MTLIPYAIALRHSSRIKLNKKPDEWGGSPRRFLNVANFATGGTDHASAVAWGM